VILPADPFALDAPWPHVAAVARAASLPPYSRPHRPDGILVDTVHSGGQTGADQGGLLGAYLAGRSTKGWAPRRWLTEDGPAPWLITWGLREHPGAGKGASVAADYAARTVANVKAADATLIVGDRRSRGSAKTIEACEAARRPYVVVGWFPGRGVDPSPATVDALRRWLREHRVIELNVAGNRESRAPGIRDATAALVRAVLAG
jgi:hypothetical protein